jgi:hypothetical protein
LTVLTASTVLTALTVLTACSSTDPTDPFPAVTATTDKASYTTAEPVVVTLTNTSSSEVGYSSCPERWDHKINADYVRFEELQQCLVGSTPLPAGASATVTYSFPEGQPAGTWRIPFPITNKDGDALGEARTEDFEIVEQAD